MTDSTDMNAIKVADFGLSKSFRRGDEPEDMRMTQFCGTMSFMAPELFADQPLYRCVRSQQQAAPRSARSLTGPFPRAQQSGGRVELRRHHLPPPHRCAASPRTSSNALG